MPARSHGQTGTRVYRIWKGMVRRGRGNHPCPRYQATPVDPSWLPENDGFRNFLADMGQPPSPLHTLDRIDNDGGYSPENCRWATRKEQALNTCRNRHITLNGETKSVSLWAEQYNISPNIVYQRLDYGWTPEQALEIVDKKVNRTKQRGERAYNAVLTEDQVRQLKKEMKSDGWSRAEAAKKLGVSKEVVRTIERGKSWSWVT